MLHKIGKSIVVLVALGSAGLVHADEVSLVHGLYSSEKNKDKISGDSQGGESAFNLGARYSTYRGDNIDLFYDAMLGRASYDSPPGVDAPSSETSYEIGAGLKYYFTSSGQLTPYVTGAVHYGSEKSVDFSGGAGYTLNESQGLSYSSNIGLRATLGEKYFVDFSIPLFKSWLFKTERAKSYGATGDLVADREKNITQLYIDADGQLFAAEVAVGMKID